MKNEFLKKLREPPFFTTNSSELSHCWSHKIRIHHWHTMSSEVISHCINCIFLSQFQQYLNHVSILSGWKVLLFIVKYWNTHADTSAKTAAVIGISATIALPFVESLHDMFISPWYLDITSLESFQQLLWKVLIQFLTIWAGVAENIGMATNCPFRVPNWDVRSCEIFC